MGVPVSRLRQKVLDLMKKDGAQTVNDLIEKLHMSNGSSRSVLVKMKEAGLIERVGHGKYNLSKSE